MKKSAKRGAVLLAIFHWSLVTSSLVTLLGCESIQKKFTRKPKSSARASPITTFQDYTHTMTPLDRYRKHYALFDYWNAELLNALQSPSLSTTMGPGQPRVNPKRVKLASKESLQELRILQELLQPEKAAQLAAIVAQRQELDERIQTGAYTASQLDFLARTVEGQDRQIGREFYWRHMTDFLAPAATPEAPASNAPADANGN